jgi:hypothetical protein
MDLRYSEEDDEFRARARAWLGTHVPPSSRAPRGRAAADFDRAWQRKLHEHGWAGIAWPKEYGGRGLSALQQVIWYEELARARAPHHINTTYVGLMHAGPTLIARGTDEQKAEFKKLLKGDDEHGHIKIAAMALSEPGTGSDISGLKTWARADGDYWIIRGSKQWITNGRSASAYVVWAQTEPAAGRAGVRDQTERGQRRHLAGREQTLQVRGRDEGRRRRRSRACVAGTAIQGCKIPRAEVRRGPGSRLCGKRCLRLPEPYRHVRTCDAGSARLRDTGRGVPGARPPGRGRRIRDCRPR